MKALVLDGSGNPNGFTSEMCQAASSVLEGAGIECSVVQLGKVWIEHCNGCLSCRKGGKCTIDDGMTAYYDALGEIDLLVFATPIRFSGPSSILKTFMDRLNPFFYSNLKHPRFAAAMMCGGADAPRFSNALSEMKALSITVGAEWAGELEVSGTDSKSREEVAAEAAHFAETLIRRIQNRTG
ncbi:Multimeric flavodoxin WrbA [Thermoplasmatales archaeon BRNA1]|nr:Multimeric flavodoxin WrbA [Thermoplasmatales archaeon BRNA1]